MTAEFNISGSTMLNFSSPVDPSIFNFSSVAIASYVGKTTAWNEVIQGTSDWTDQNQTVNNWTVL